MRDSPMLSAALRYIRRGWVVIPVHGVIRGRCTCGRRKCSSPGKHPLTARGKGDATTDAAVVRMWWSRWRAANVGVVTGTASGIAVVDVDLPRGATSIAQLMDRLPCTLTALTGGGGLHLVYSCDRRLRNTTGRLPGVDTALPGIDLRAEGGYVLVPPSRHVSGESYRWVEPPASVSPLPPWLAEHAPRTGRATLRRSVRFEGDQSTYGLSVQCAELARVSRAPKGQRNHELNRAAFAIAQLVAGGELCERRARAALTLEAQSIGLPDREAQATIRSAFRAGWARPRSAPHRLARDPVLD